MEWQVGYTAASGSRRGFDSTALAFLRIFLATHEDRGQVSPTTGKPGRGRAVKCTQNLDCVGSGTCFDGVCRK